MTAPSHFSAVNPDLQLAWDNTSLKTLQFCPRRYQLEIKEGWRPVEGGNYGSATLDLWFGGIFASAAEVYRRMRLNGHDKAEATIEAVREALQRSGHYVGSDGLEDFDDNADGLGGTEVTWVPDGGVYVDQWRCSGTKPYKNAKGNRAVCPLAHKGVWQFAELPSVCPHCGSTTVKENHWIPAATKDRYALVRLVIGYCDSQPEDPSDGLYPYQFPDGTAAVELPWRIPTDIRASTGEAYILAGYFDAIVTYNDDEVFVLDNKTTTKPLNKSYWDKYSPDMQVDLYDLAASVLYPTLGVRGVIIEAASFTPSSHGLQANYSPQPLYRTEPLRQETLQDIEYWLGQADKYAQDHYWPMAKSNCWLCPFKGICSLEPDQRKTFLTGGGFEQRPWNPLEER